jgi:hypothetical protein
MMSGSNIKDYRTAIESTGNPFLDRALVLAGSDAQLTRARNALKINNVSNQGELDKIAAWLNNPSGSGGSSSNGNSSTANSNSTPTSTMANANDFYEAALTAVGGDKSKLDALQKELGYNNINSAREVEQIRMHYNAQNAPAQQPAAQQPAQQPANQTFNPADYAPKDVAAPVEEPTYLEQKSSEYEATPQASVYEDFLKAIQQRDAKVASGEAGPLDSIDRVASDSGERSWDSYAKEWGVSAPSTSSASSGAGRMAGGDDFMNKLLAAGGVSGYADSGNQDKRRYMN